MTKQHQQWIEPKRKNAPSLTARAVMEELQFKNVESVHILARRGPEQDGLPGYIPADNGRGWQRKHGSGYSGVQLFFYPEDVQKWKNEHPFVEQERQRIAYSNEEAKQVLEEAVRLRNPNDGSVTRTKVQAALAEKYGRNVWNARAYKKIKQVLDDHDIPLPPTRRNAALRRQYRAS